jgi:hypothetical protein
MCSFRTTARDEARHLLQSQTLKETLKSVLESVSASLKAPVAKTDVEIDLSSQNIRTREVRFSERPFSFPDSLVS